MAKKIIAIIGVILLIFLGNAIGRYFFGFLGTVVGALSGAALGGYALKRSEIVSPNSSLVSETLGVRTAKYILLGIVTVALLAFAYFGLFQ